MKKNIFILINGIAWGEVYGLAFSILFSYLYGLNEYEPSDPIFMSHFVRPLDAVLTSTIIWGLMGLLFSAGVLIFKIDKWSLSKKTIINFVVYFCGFTPLAILAGWLTFTIKDMIIFTVIFILVYLVIWGINMIKIRREIQEINEKLKK